MSQRIIAHPFAGVQRDAAFVLPLPIIECGSMSIVLDMLPAYATVLLMPTLRRDAVLSRIDVRLAVQVTARIEDERDGPAILTATFLAAAYTGGSPGKATLFLPEEERAKPAGYIESRASDLQGELLTCLLDCLSAHPHVRDVRHPARYGVPHEWVWHPASLDGSGISFDRGHWTRPVPQPDAPATPYDVSLA